MRELYQKISSQSSSAILESVKQIVTDSDQAIAVMHHVGTWMEEAGLHPSKWWQPQHMNRQFMLQHAEPEEFFVLLIDDQPAASCVLQDSERNQSWQAVDGDQSQPALYVHWVCVHRDYAGQNLVTDLIKFAKEQAIERGFTRLRLDTDADQPKLCELYESLGFKKVGEEQDGSHHTAFYEILLKK